ncbi:MAG: amino acid ABC transporter substrate-binding protein [Chloroflexi bacterium]|nr:amino acid ABC transporter substrate-binding protein [Chloroflexota bacterium]
MAARPWRLILPMLLAAITLWLWALAGMLFVIRWNSVERPGPPVRVLFPYGEMRVGVDASYPPFAVATADDLFGLDIDLGRAIAERIGMPLRFVNMGYDGLYDALKADQVDVVISALLIDSSRTNDVLYTLPYYNAGFVLVSRADQPLTTMNDMSGHALAYEFGSDADTFARAWLRRIPPFETRPYELPTYALDAVRLGEADAALVDATSARLYLRDHPDWDAPMRYVSDSLYAIAVRINRGQTWEAVNAALQSLINDGTLAEIMRRWL